MHEHLYIKKNTRKVNLFNGKSLLTVKYECECGDWWKRQIKEGETAPKIWNWPLLSDQPIKLQSSPTL